jgi:methionyl-tRNA synthetase
MESNKKELLTTAIAYANGAPHIGHALEFIYADTLNRYAKEEGRDVYFITGMDEHGQKIEQKAKELGIPVQTFVDQNAQTFKDLDAATGVLYDFFVRTSDKEKHYKGAQALWNKLAENGDLEKRVYTALYCVGCESFKTEKDLNEKGECPDHLKKPEEVEEENYFFKLSKYTTQIKAAITEGKMQIIPDTRRNEILALLDRGLEDVSFSRPASKVSWGIPVPGDESQVMYVWCDALSNYITAIGYGTDTFDSVRANHMIHIIGKDILRFHAAIWPGMLLSAGLSLPEKILVHGHITSGGQKMSKSLGNVISPQELLELFAPATEYPGEVLRFILLHEIPSFDDGDLTIDSIKTAYTAYLANGIGNLTNRIMKMATSYGVIFTEEDIKFHEGNKNNSLIYKTFLEQSNANLSLQDVMKTYVRAIDEQIQRDEPFKVYKVDEEKAKVMVKHLLSKLYQLGSVLSVFMPQTSAKIFECISENKMPEKALFNRLS